MRFVFYCCVFLVLFITELAFASTADSLRAVIQGNERTSATVDALNKYAMLLHETYPDSTRLLATRALALADSLQDWKGKALSLNGIGVSYFIQNNYEKALEYYLQALSLREKIADMQGVAGTLNNVGMVYRDMKEYSTALTYYFRALRLNDSLRNMTFFVRNLNNIGVAYESLGEFDSALVYHRRSLEIKRAINDKAGIASTMRNIGKVYVRMKRTTEALTALQEALAIPEVGKQVRALILLDMAQVREETQDYGTGIEHAHTAMMLGRELGAALILQQAHEALARLYARKQQHKQALEHYQRFITIRDSLFNENSSRRLAALQTNYEIERQRSQIELLTKDKELQNTVRNALIGGFALMGVLFVVSAIAYRNKRRSNEQLRETNAEILRQQGLLEEQAEEIELANTTLSENNIELKNANQSLQTLNMEKNEIMGIVAHDLKNPIGAIHGLAELVTGGFVEPEQFHAIAAQIMSTSDRMLDLVKNLLDVNRLEQGGMTFTLLRFDIAPLVESTIDQYRQPAAAKQIALHYTTETASNLVLADERAMMQIIDNLVSNAVKYSPYGKNIFARIRHISRPQAPSNQVTNFVRIEIQDEGPGISPNDMKRLFGKFARLSAQPTGGEHSTGLGLSIVKKIVEAMNGAVWCESEEGKGATFIVEFPQA